MPLKVLTLYSEISKDVVQSRLSAGQISGCGDEVPQLTCEEIHSTPRLLAQMGPEPILKAMLANPDFDILVAGRAYDPAIFVAFCAINQADSPSAPLTSFSNSLMGGYYHMGKIMECGGLCATPKSAGAIAMMYQDGVFDISPMDPRARCTSLSVAAHTLYEKSRPDLLHGPGGCLDLNQTTYEELPDGISVRVRGAEFAFSTSEGLPYTVKLEGARVIGFRTLFFGSFVDPILTGQIHEYLDAVKARCAAQHKDMEGKWKLDFHIHGAPAKQSEPGGVDIVDNPDAGEVFIVGEVLADSPTLSKSIASTARVSCSHGAYIGQMATSGNFAFGIGGMTEVDVGPCCQFSVYHLMSLVEGEEVGHLISIEQQTIVPVGRTKEGLFPWRVTVLGASTSVPGSNGIPSTTGTRTHISGATKPAIESPAKTNGVAKRYTHAKTLKDVAKVIRSKNAGPFQVTFDVMFDESNTYQAVKNSGILSQATMAQLFQRPASDIVWCGFFDQALAFKLTLARKRNGELRCSGGYMENDVHGSQQYMPLMRLPLSEDLKLALQGL
jgi:hypothetical protein